MPSDPSEEFKKSKVARIAKVIARQRVMLEPDRQTEEETKDLEHQNLKEKIRSLSQDIDERKKYARYFFVLSCCWLVAIMTILMLQGFGSFWFGSMPFTLHDNVMLALMGSTTANLLGILHVVAKYLFPKRQ